MYTLKIVGVGTLCMIHKFRYKSMHPFYGGLPMPHVPVWVSLGSLVITASS